MRCSDRRRDHAGERLVPGRRRALPPHLVRVDRLGPEPGRRVRDVALSHMATPSKPRGCGLARRRVADVEATRRATGRTGVVERETRRPARSEITETTRGAVQAWIVRPAMTGSARRWPSPFDESPQNATRQRVRMRKGRVACLGREPGAHGAHTMRRTTAAQVDRADGNLRAVRLPLGRARADSTVRDLGGGPEGAPALSKDVALRSAGGAEPPCAQGVTSGREAGRGAVRANARNVLSRGRAMPEAVVPSDAPHRRSRRRTLWWSKVDREGGDAVRRRGLRLARDPRADGTAPLHSGPGRRGRMSKHRTTGARLRPRDARSTGPGLSTALGPEPADASRRARNPGPRRRRPPPRCPPVSPGRGPRRRRCARASGPS